MRGQSWAILAGAAMGAFLLGCGGNQGLRGHHELCGVGESHLRQKLGPEFGKIHSKVSFIMPEKEPHGCALVYSLIPEELPMEMTGDVLEGDISDQMLGIVFNDGANQPRFTRVPRSRTAPGAVKLKLSKRDVNGDGAPDLVVEEQGAESGLDLPYRGLRIFDGNVGGGREFFSGALLITTKEGMRIIPKWKVSKRGLNSALVFSAAGIEHTYVYDHTQRRFTLFAVPQKVIAPKKDTTPKLVEKASPAQSTAAELSKPSKAKNEAGHQDKN